MIDLMASPPFSLLIKMGGGRKFAGVAQLVEHLTCNQGVVGSIPIAGTTGILWGDSEVAKRGRL
jgi:hypothetical protein